LSRHFVSRPSYGPTSRPRAATKIDRVARDGPFLGDRPVDAFVSDRRVARVDAGLLSLRSDYGGYRFALPLVAVLAPSGCLQRGTGGSFFSTPFVLSSTLTAARSYTCTPHTHIHTRARASIHTHTLGRGQSRARARTIRSPRPSCSDPPLEAALSLSLSLSRTRCPPSLPLLSHLPPLPRFLVQPSFALFPPRRPDVSPSKQRGRHKGSLVGKRQAEAFAHARLSLVDALDEELSTFFTFVYFLLSPSRCSFSLGDASSGYHGGDSVLDTDCRGDESNRHEPYCIATRQSFAQRTPRQLATGRPVLHPLYPIRDPLRELSPPHPRRSSCKAVVVYVDSATQPEDDSYAAGCETRFLSLSLSIRLSL